VKTENVKRAIPLVKSSMKLTEIIYAIKIHPLLVIITLSIIIYFPITYRSALSHAEDYDRYGRTNNAELAISNIKKATEQDPLNGMYNLKYLSYLLTKRNATQGEMDNVVDLTKKVEKASAYDVNLATSYAAALLTAGNINKGMEYIDHGIELRPHYQVQWKTKINACYQIAILYLSAGDINKAFTYADKGIVAMEEARKINEESVVPFSLDAELMVNLEKLKYILDNAKNDKKLDVNAILFYNISRMDVNADGVPDQWVIDNPVQNKLESSENGMSLIGEGGFIQSRPLNFEAGKKYRVEVKVQNADKTIKIPFIIAAIMSENGFLEYSDGKFSGTLDLSGSASAISGALRLELQGDCVVEEVLVEEV
jgi:tetratricopeptide (TPR) repeat protein